MVYAGTIIEISNKKTYVFTMDCSVVTLRTKDDYILGQQITFTKRDKYPELIHSISMKTMAIAAAFVLVVASAVTTASLFHDQSQSGFDPVPTALVSVDINPSIEISINKEEQIVSAQAKNEDGIKLLNSLDLTHKNLVDGVNELITAAREMGYLNESKKVVLVSAALYETEDGDASSKYEQQLKEILGKLQSEDDSTDLLTVYIDDSAIIQEAKDNNLSIGKELLYQYAQTQDAPLTAEEIRSAGLKELLDKLNALEKDGNLVDTLQNPDSVQSAEKPISTTSPSAQAKTETEAQTETAETAKPDPATPSKETAGQNFDPSLKVGTDGTIIRFDWRGIPSKGTTFNGKDYFGFKYYKVVASQTNSHPVYPDDGYLAVISDYSDSDWSVDPAKGNYNYSPELRSGETYYVSITYVFENGKFTSDVKKITVRNYHQEEESETISSLELSVTSSGDTLTFNWTPIGDSSMNYNGKTYEGFNFYKVVASKSNASPKYPEDGYLTYISDYNASFWSVNPSSGEYNHSPELESGETYYFSITYVFGNGKVCSNTVQYTVP